MKLAQWEKKPFPHVMGVGAFPDDVYLEMLANLPTEFERLYPKRFVAKKLNTFWHEMLREFIAGHRHRAWIFRDLPGYEVGPHTDSPKDIQTLIFYLTDKEQSSGGTSVFIPKNKDFSCNGQRWHKFKDFELVKTAPYVPNGYYGHIRTNKSFHGVYPVNFERLSLQITLYQ